MIYLHKIIPLLISPLIFVIFLFILGVYYNSKKIIFSALTVLILSSTPILSDKLVNYLEIDYEPINIEDVEKADAIIVLSGMINTLQTKNIYNYEFNGAVDRFIKGIDLFKNGKANYLVFTRGKIPWSVGISEGEYLKKLAINFGVPEKKIILTESVENTEQEANSIKNIFPNKNSKLILVTSAYHMKRALKIFNSAELKVLAYPVDFRKKTKKFTIMDIIPSANAFSKTSYSIREIIGRIYYNFKLK